MNIIKVICENNARPVLKTYEILRQRVKIGDALSDWLQMAAGMPQGSHLGPLTFVILIDALQPGCLTHKYVDDTTMTEFLSRSAVSSMQSLVDELVPQATDTNCHTN